MRKLLLPLLYIVAIVSSAQNVKIDSLKSIPLENRDHGFYVSLIEASIESIRSNPAILKRNFEEAVSWSKKNNKDSLMASAANGLGRVYTYLGKYDSAHQWFRMMQETSQDIKAYDLDNSYFMNRGITFFYEGKYDSAGFLFEKAYLLAKEYEHDSDLSKSSNNLGLVFMYAGNNHKALEWLLNSAEIDERLEDMAGVSKSYNNIAMLHNRMGSLELAKKFYRMSLNIKTEIDDQIGLFGSYLNLGNIFRDEYQYDSASILLSIAEKIADTLDYRKGIAMVSSALSMLEHNKKNYTEAESYSLKSVRIAQETQDKSMLANGLMNLGDAQRMLGKYSIAIKNVEEGLKLSSEINEVEYVEAGLLILSEIYVQLNQYKPAFGAFKEHVGLKDSIKSLENKKFISQLQIKYETAKKQQQIALQNSQLSEQEAELERRQILLIASAFALILFVTLGFLQRSRLKKKQQLKLQEAELRAQKAEINATVSSQEKERTRYARDLHDGFGQMISVLNMNLKGLEEDRNPNERQEIFNASSEVIDDMYKELRSICFDLMPQTLIKHGLVQGLDELAQRINRAKEVFVEINAFGLEVRPSDVQEISLYRISQEWINNTLKYSDADKIVVQITKDENEITLLIEDNGSGFDKGALIQSDGYGWKNMNVRAKIISGEIELETLPGVKGNTFILNAPAQLSGVNSEENTIKTV